MSISLSFLGRYNAGSFDTSRAEIVATDGVNSNRAYVVNGNENRIDILDITNPASPSLNSSVTLTAPTGKFYTINSVAGYDGLLVAAVGVSSVSGRNPEEGAAIFFKPDGTILGTVAVGAGPDMVTFSPNGRKVLLANEGEPVTTSGSTIDPDGSVTIIDLPAFTAATVSATTIASATTATIGFGSLTTDQQNAALAQGLKIQPGKTFAQDLEPEYVAGSSDGKRAYVTLQENNGLATINLENNTLVSVQGLRSINMNVSPQFQLDASDQDGPSINIKNQPVRALFQPDAIQTFDVNGKTYLITANEGDMRDWTGTNFPTTIVEALRVGNNGYTINPLATNPVNPTAPNLPITTYSDVITTTAGAANAKAAANLGRLNATTWAGDTNTGTAGFEQITIGGSRSVSIWDASGNLVWDSGKFLETLTAGRYPNNFNASHTSNSADSRSDDKGPEPEGVEVGVVNGVPYAFVGLERQGGVVVFDLSNPSKPNFVQYINTRDFTQTPAAGAGGDLGPEGLKFISADKSPNGKPMLAVAHEVSNTTTFFEIATPKTAQQEGAPAGVAYRLQIIHGSDFEAGLKAISPDGGGQTARASNFAAIVDKLEDEFANTVILSGGDNFLPGPVYSAGGDATLNPTYNWLYNKFYDRPTDANGLAVDINGDNVVDGYNSLAAGPGRVDATLLNIIGIQASALGNHDFDSGPRELANIARQTYSGAAGPASDTWVGVQFPYLSANLNFSGDNESSSDTAAAYTNQIREWSTYRTGPVDSIGAVTNNAQAKFAPSTIITENGEKIAVIGATTQLLASISSPQKVRVVDKDGNPLPSADDMVKLAAQINAETARIKTADPTINKFILASHLQQLNNEKTLAPLLNDIDVVLAAGSHTLAADPSDPLRPGDTATETYPIVTTNASGNNALIIVTANEYAYVGRLVADFDTQGNIVTTGINAATSDAFSTDWNGVKRVYNLATDSSTDAALATAAFSQGSKGYYSEVMINGVNRQTGAIDYANNLGANGLSGVADVIAAKDGNIFGKTSVYLDGLRVDVRTQETNLGNLSADANLWYAKFYDPSVTVSLKNGGGIRDSIGSASGAGGSTTVTLGPTAANPSAGKNAGDVSQLDIENSLRFNNGLTLVTVTAQELERIFEYSVAASSAGVTQGRFPQLSGIEVSYDLSQQAIVFGNTGNVTTEGQRIRSLALTDQNGNVTTKLVENGVFVGDASQQIRMVTLNFLAGSTSQTIFGGDGYPFPLFGADGNRVDLQTQSGFPAAPGGLNAGSLPNAATFATQGTEQDAFAEYMKANHSVTPFDKPETEPYNDLRQFNQTASTGNDRLAGSSLADVINGLAGEDLINGKAGNDNLSGDIGNDAIFGGVGADTVAGGVGGDALDGGADIDTLTYAASTAGVTINLRTSSASGGDAAGDTIANFENVIGGSGNDRLTGNAGANVIMGGLGQNVLDGAGPNRDSVVDFASYEWANFSINASLTRETARGVGVTDTLRNFEGLIGGSADDRLSGNDFANTLIGGGGNDRLFGDRGADILTGGLGRDTFVFSLRDSGQDRVTDFQSGVGGDVIAIDILFASRAPSISRLLDDRVITQTVVGTDLVIGWDADGARGRRPSEAIVTLKDMTNLLVADNFAII